jgi:hypothetical protein
MKRLVFRGSNLNEVVEDGGWDVVMVEMLLEDGVIATGFHLRELGLEDGVIDFAIGVLVFLEIAIEGFEDKASIILLIKGFDDVGPVGMVDLHFFSATEFYLSRGVVADGEGGIKASA